MPILYFDGGCEPTNPGGTMSWAYAIQRMDGSLIRSNAGTVGPAAAAHRTNNIAEYLAVLAGLQSLLAARCAGQKIEVRGDSKLVINQVNGKWGGEAVHLLALRNKCLAAVEGLKRLGNTITFCWIPREQNDVADGLGRAAMLRAGIVPTDRTRFKKYASKKNHGGKRRKV